MIKNIASSSLCVPAHLYPQRQCTTMTCTSNARPPDPHALLTPPHPPSHPPPQNPPCLRQRHGKRRPSGCSFGYFHGKLFQRPPWMMHRNGFALCPIHRYNHFDLFGAFWHLDFKRLPSRRSLGHCGGVHQIGHVWIGEWNLVSGSLALWDGEGQGVEFLVDNRWFGSGEQ
jgi:hypothetical protein